MMNRAFICGIFLALSLKAEASDIGVRAQSFGQAFRAVASSNDIIFSNPAGLIKTRRLGIEADYQLSTFNEASRLTLSIVDSQTTSWGMGLGYSADIRDSKNTSHLAYLSMAMPIGTDMISLGGSLNYLFEPNKNYRHYFNGDLALMISLPIGVSLAVVLDHLVKPKGTEKTMGLALASALELGKIVPVVPLTISFDWLMNDIRSDYDLKNVISVGGEFVLLSFVPIRVGYKSDVDKYLSLGLGVYAPIFSVDAVFQQNFTHVKERFWGLALRFNI